MSLRDRFRRAPNGNGMAATQVGEAEPLAAPKNGHLNEYQEMKRKLHRELIGKLARTQAPVYISGESGSGKELAARLIHGEGARRAELPARREARGRRGAEQRPVRDHPLNFVTAWSIAPKIDCPPASRISIRTRSPNFRNGVCALPFLRISSARRSSRGGSPSSGPRRASPS